MKYIFPKGHKINNGRKSHRKGKSMIEECGKEKAEEIKKRTSEKQKGKHYFKREMNCQRCGKKLISYTITQKYCLPCKRFIGNHKYYNNNKEKCIIRSKTKFIFGELEKGYEYHHFEPYQYDNFVILEKGLHRWMHGHPESFKLGGLNKSIEVIQ